MPLRGMETRAFVPHGGVIDGAVFGSLFFGARAGIGGLSPTYRDGVSVALWRTGAVKNVHFGRSTARFRHPQDRLASTRHRCPVVYFCLGASCCLPTCASLSYLRFPPRVPSYIPSEHK